MSVLRTRRVPSGGAGDRENRRRGTRMNADPNRLQGWSPPHLIRVHLRLSVAQDPLRRVTPLDRFGSTEASQLEEF